MAATSFAAATSSGAAAAKSAAAASYALDAASCATTAAITVAGAGALVAAVGSFRGVVAKKDRPSRGSALETAPKGCLPGASCTPPAVACLQRIHVLSRDYARLSPSLSAASRVEVKHGES